MFDILNIGIQCTSPLQIIGLLIIALLLRSIVFLIYKAIRFLAVCLLNFRKVDVHIDSDDFNIDTHLNQN